MNTFPVFLTIEDRACLVVGGGEVAARKTALLLRARGTVTVLAPRLCARLNHLESRNRINHENKEFEPTDIGEQLLVVAATNDSRVNRQVAERAGERGIPVNVVDQPELCTFTIPSIIDRSPVIVAISTGGASPVLARLLRARLETLIPAAYGKLGALVNRYRGQVKQQFPTVDDRRRFWESVLQGPIAEMLLSGKEASADKALNEAVASKQVDATRGEVYLVGAGPGDPDLLTFRALRLMQQADVVLYDRLVSKEVLDLTRRDAERIYVGKERSRHTMAQPKINERLAALAMQGKRVLRLKGGDPFIFGRGGEEIGELSRHDIPFQVVPGITAASGCASYAGIPLTHRDYAHSCIFVTGHSKDGTLDLDWAQLIQPRQTVVIYMSLTGLPTICAELISHGAGPETPIALIEQGTTPRQRVLTGSLSTLPGMIEKIDVNPPTLAIIGEVVRLHESLAWFNTGDA